MTLDKNLTEGLALVVVDGQSWYMPIELADAELTHVGYTYLRQHHYVANFRGNIQPPPKKINWQLLGRSL